MKIKNKAVLSLMLTVAVIAALLTPAFAGETPLAGQLKFNEDGTFTILQITDTQDTQWPSPNCLTLIQKSLDESKPDLVVFTGDQLKNYDSDFGTTGHKWKVEKAIAAIVKPVVARGIPFAVAFGNHDSCLTVTLEEQVKMFQKYSGCLLADEGPGISGCGNYNLPVISSDGTHTAFNIYLLDSNQDSVRQDQIDWYISKSNELKAANAGVPVPSIEFQHIVPYNDNLVSAFAAQGDVIASFFGHDHYRTDNYRYMGIDFTYTPTAGFNAFGPGKECGTRVIELNENDTSRYDTRLLTFIGLLGDNPITDLRYKLFTLGALEGNFFNNTFEVLSGIGKALSYLGTVSNGNPKIIFTQLLEFFGTDTGLNK